jgi:hypothetical protein
MYDYSYYAVVSSNSVSYCCMYTDTKVAANTLFVSFTHVTLDEKHMNYVDNASLLPTLTYKLL